MSTTDRSSASSRRPSRARRDSPARRDGEPPAGVDFAAAIDGLVERLRGGTPSAGVPRLAACAGIDQLASPAVRLPAWLLAHPGDRPARWLLHRDQDTGAEVLAVTWGPCQRFGLHDHGGLTSVATVLTGVVVVRPYTQIGQHPDGRCRLVPNRLRFCPPGDVTFHPGGDTHHAVANARADEVAVTLHVFGGVLGRCRRYHPVGPAGKGWRSPREAAPTTSAPPHQQC